jgi:hypothetical protein
MPANPLVQFTQFSDPVLRGSVYGTFKEWNQNQTEIYKQIFETIDTQKPFEEFAEFATLGLAPRQNEGQLAASDVVKEGYNFRLSVFLYGLNMNVGQIALKTKQLREAIGGTKAVAEALYNTREIIHADLFGNAFSTTLGLLPDSLPICTASGKLPRGGTMTNTLGAASFHETTVESAYILADKMPGGHGIPVGKEIEALLIPPDYRFDAIRIFNSALQNWTANNATNALKSDGAVPKVIRNRFLPSSSNFFFLTNAELGLLSVWLQKPDVEEVGQSLTKSTVFYGSQIFGTGCVNRRKVIGSSI